MITGRNKANTVITNNNRLVKSFDFWKDKEEAPKSSPSPSTSAPATHSVNAPTTSPPTNERERERDKSGERGVKLLGNLSPDANDKRKSSSSINVVHSTLNSKVPKLTTSLSSDNLNLQMPPQTPTRVYISRDDSSTGTSTNNTSKLDLLEERLAREKYKRAELEKCVKYVTYICTTSAYMKLCDCLYFHPFQRLYSNIVRVCVLCRRLEEELSRSEAKQAHDNNKRVQKLNEDYSALQSDYKRMEKELIEIKNELRERETNIKNLSQSLSKSTIMRTSSEDNASASDTSGSDTKIKKATSFNDTLRNSNNKGIATTTL